MTNKCVWTIHVGPGRSWKWSWDTAKSEASLPLHRPPPRSPRAQRFHTFCPRRCSFGMSQLKVPVNQFLKRWRGNEFCWFLVVCKIAIWWWFDHSSPYCPFVVVIMIEKYSFFILNHIFCLSFKPRFARWQMLTPNSHNSGLTHRNWQDIQQRRVATAWITADSQHALNRFTARRWRRSVCLQCGATLADVVRVVMQIFDKEKQPADYQVIDKSMIIIHKWYQMFVNAIPGLIRHGDWMNLQGTWKESSHLLLFFRLGLWASVWYQSETTSTSLLLRDFAVSTQCFSNGCRYCISVKGFITNWVLGAQIVFAQTVANLEAVHVAVCFSREHQVTSIWERIVWYVCCKCSNSIASWKHIGFKCSCHSKCLIGSLLSRPDNEIRD